MALGTAKETRIVGHFGGYTGSVCVDGQRLYCGFGPELAIFDIVKPGHLVRRGGALLGESIGIGRIRVQGSYAYVTSAARGIGAIEGGLVVVDVADATKPRAVGYLPTRLSSTSIALERPYVYLGVQDDGLLIVDVREPTFPIVAGSYQPPRVDKDIYPRVWEVAYANGRVFLNCGVLDIVDVSEPATPRHVGYLDVRIGSLVVAGHFGVITSNEPYGTLQIVDISRADQPVVVGRSVVDEWWEFVEDITVVGDLVAAIGQDEGGEGYLRLFDISRREKPRYLGALALPGHSVAGSGTTLYAGSAEPGGIVVVDVSDPRQPAFRGGYPTVAMAEKILVENKTAYVIGAEGFYILDISNPLSASVTGHFSDTRVIRDMDVVGERVYLAEGPLGAEAIAMDGTGGGLRILDISDPREPRGIGFYEPPDLDVPYDVVVAGSNAYMLC